ncbi:sensor histidine kinase [Flavobacterium lindanitolerans]|uniref:histidine kinase n=1 Tax=Flavobacterium lindanitolerans TaxID=428988 RepID=A0A497U6L9_9FLAO|nr:ATP-binding protein [Flavobacterium lindanitolerans]PKW20545.1 phospho-acceptor domain-containing protein [Flavobacterium lindanitolerans]RLJ23988.1 phospho-acceptor domain-containing protein [Flavobacterium lindanitolerans]
MLEISTEEKLKERIKELSCLYDISKTTSMNANCSESALREICTIVKIAWRFSDVSIVELQCNDFYFTTSKLPEDTRFQVSCISIFEKEAGYIKVHYPISSGAFFLIEEEQQLLDKVALEIGNYIEKNHIREREKQLQRSVERIDRLSILGEITAGIAHELNTPLGNILGFAELINEQNIDRQVAQDVSKIINAAIYSREIVKKLMFFSCEMPQNMEIVPIKPIVVEALSLLGPNFKKAQVSYELIFDNPELKAQIDNIQLTQVLFNILINSIYVAPENSSITVKVTDDSNNFYIEIADEGSGIPEEIKSRIFEPFFTTKPIGEGSGLGLSVVHGIVKSHKGDIIALDNQPKGTIFHVRLPLNS